MCGAHIKAWEDRNGPVPPGLQVLHECDNPPCTNVDHLFLGTHSDNMRDRHTKGRYVGLKGEKSSHSKLTWSEVRSIRIAYPSTSQRKLAKAYGVSLRTIQFIVTDKHWKEAA